ncbi:hypothetical protein [Dyadobacter chenhuakuii]|uniref:Uncharacterized protein n=1 Tax=Dyadobacter chenhuakuii TaxID=2909339 RepID=A0A9X1TVW0_9BACT|nr:hypothetical protein [Dyadobacter chenhuakuii]MCF2501715.1 hypothetical protein [Dyadobacter chenhuakuii]
MRRIWYGYTKKKASLTVALNWPKGKGIAPQAGGLDYWYLTNGKIRHYAGSFWRL